jgi:hypothetical protein
LLKLAIIGILGGLLLLWGPLGGMFWPGLALIAVGGLSLLLALRTIVRRAPEDDIEAERPVRHLEDGIGAEDPVLTIDDLEDPPTPDPVAADRRHFGLEIIFRVVMAVGTVALVYMNVFRRSPQAVESRKREEKLRRDLIQLEKDARAGKTGKALQFLVTGDRSLLEAAKREAAGRPAVKGQGNPRPPSPRP